MAEPGRTRGMGIQNWLTLLLLLIFLPLLALQGYMYYNYYQEKQEEALQSNLEIARAVAKSFDSFVQDVLRQEFAIGLAMTSSQKMTPGNIIRLLETSNDYPAVRDFNWLNPEGIAIYSNNPAIIGTNFSDRSFVRDVVSGREWAVGELVTGKLFGKPIFGISRGIRDDKGNLLGVIFAAILPDKLDAQLAIERSKGGAISLVDRQGMLVYRYPAIETTWEDRNWLRQYPEYEEVFRGKEISKTFFATYEGKDRLSSIVPISSIGWAAGAGKRKEDVTGPIIQSLVRDAVLFLSISLIAFLIAAALSRKITTPIESLRTYASSLGEGKAPNKVDVGNVPELQNLAESFATMAKEVSSREAALRLAHDRAEWLARFPEENPNPVIRVSLDGKALYCNPASVKMVGWKCEIGKSIPDPLLPYIMEAVEEDREVEQDVELGEKTYTIAIVPFSEENYVNVYGRDITERKRAEEELQKLAAVVRHSSAFINIATLDGKMVVLNEAGADMVGLSAEEVAQTHILQVIPGHLQDKVNNEVLPTLKEKGFWEGELQYLNLKTGQLTDVYATTFSIKDPEKGTTLFMANSSIDITKRKRLEEETQRLLASVLEEKDRLSALINSMSDEVWFADADKRVTLVNPAVWKEFGAVLGIREEVEKIAASFEVYREDGTPRPVEEAPPLRALRGEAIINEEEIVRTPATGELRHRQVSAAPVRRPDGSVLGSVSVVRDITERKRTEEVLKRKQVEIQALFNNAPAGLVLFDAVKPYTVLVHNRYYQEIFAEPYRSQGMVGLNIYEYAPEVEATGVAAVFDEVIRTKQAKSFLDFPYNSNPAAESWFNWHMSPILLDDKVVALVSMSIDVTDYHRAEEALREANEFLEQRVRDRTLELQNLAEQLEKSRDDLRILASELVLAEERERKRIAAVLHDDIAQTLAVVRMRVDLLQNMANDDESRQTVKDAKEFLVQSIRETRALMNDLCNPALFELGVAAACESLADRLMANHPIQIRCDIRDSFKNLEPEVKVILFQVVREMLNNVVKHSKAQHAEVLVHWEDDRIRAMVRDDGLGFDPQSIGAPTAEGGFGLFSIRERLMSFRGDLQIESAPGAGTIVTATVPARLKREFRTERTAF